jgi:hypothetical protein
VSTEPFEPDDDTLTLGDLIDIDVLIEHQCRVLADMEITLFAESNRGKCIVLMQRRQELKSLQQRVRNTRTERLIAGER